MLRQRRYPAILASVLFSVLCASPASAQFVIKDDATGGDCQGKLKAQWNVQSRTCTLAANLQGTSAADRPRAVNARVTGGAS